MKLNYKILATILLLSPLVFAQKSAMTKELIEKAKKIHDNIITLDTHNDFSNGNFTKEKNYTQELSNQVNLPKMIKGGLDVSWLIVYTGQGELNEEGYKKAHKKAMEKFNSIHRLVNEYAPDQIELAITSADVKRIIASGKKVVMIGIENGYPLGLDIGNVKKFYDLGGRYMSLAHNGHSQLSDSNTGEKDGVWLYNGLSNLGKAALEEMNKWGIMVDVSHPSKQAFMDMIELSKAPIIASHSSSRVLCNHSRNLDDEQLLALKKNGGVVQTVAFKSYLNTGKNNAYNKAQRDALYKVANKNKFEILESSAKGKLNKQETTAYETAYKILLKKAERSLKKATRNSPPVDVGDFVNHIDYMVKLIGINHVGISSDFDGGGGIFGWNDASETFNVTLELVKRGYTENQISKLWGLNLLRVLDEVQKVSKEIQSKK